MMSDVEHLFMYINVYLVLLPIFKSGCLFFDVELYELFTYVGY